MLHNNSKIGIILPQWEGAMEGETPRGTDMIAQAKLSEEVGFDSLWVVDVILYDIEEYRALAEGNPTEILEGGRLGYWECWTVLSAMAVATSRVEIGTLVTCTAYRNPALLACMADTVDELSGGRLILGVGAGVMESEFETFGYDWDRRVSRFEEALQIICPMLRGESSTFNGEFYRTRGAQLVPKGIRPDGPPILIGTQGEGPRMRRLVAQYAHHWNCWFGEFPRLDSYQEAYDSVRRDCEKFQRDPATLTKNVAVGVCLQGHSPEPGEQPLTGTTTQIADQLNEFLNAGVDHLIIHLTPNTRAGIEKFSQVLSLLE